MFKITVVIAPRNVNNQTIKSLTVETKENNVVTADEFGNRIKNKLALLREKNLTIAE